MTAGGEEPELHYVVEGLLNGDSLRAEPTLSWDSSKKNIAGDHLISIKLADGAVSGNYAPVLIPGTMTVKPGAVQLLPNGNGGQNASSGNAGAGSGNSGGSGSSGSGGGSGNSGNSGSSGSGAKENLSNLGAADNGTTETPWRFVDVPDSHWAAEAVYYLADRGLVNGTSATHYSPDAHMTREMLMTVLARASGVDTTGDPYSKGMRWAVQSGVSDGSDPTIQITREQLAVMLWRFAGQPAPTADTLSDFADADEISEYARTAMQWAHENGIVQGKGDGILDPKGWATRAEVAEMLMRHLK
jgi:hypothetical protein